MMKQVLLNIIAENQHIEFPKIVPRDLEIPLHQQVIISIIGSRRSGKTYLLYYLMEQLLKNKVPRKNILFLNFEDERLTLKTDSLDLVLQAYRELHPEVNLKEVYFFFDEIQNVEGWEKFIRRIFDTLSKNIFITGSNSKLLSTEIATELRGRTLPFTLYPLNFKEYLRFNNIDPKLYPQQNRSKIINAAKHFLIEGGFPETITFDPQNRTRMHQQYFNVMIFRDIIERYKVTDPEMLKFFIKKIFSNVTKPFSINKIYHELKSLGYKVSNNYLYEYLSHCQAVFLAQLINKFHYSEIKQEKAEKKAYVVDNGLLSAVDMMASQNNGKLLENLIAMEFIKSEKQVFFFKEKTECDFIIKDSNEYQAIQVSYEMEDEDTLHRECRGLYEACNYLGQNTGIILTFDIEKEVLYKKMKFNVVPFYKYFL